MVIGAGHNGLAAAAYLARAGQQVLVLESRPSVGGFCSSLANVAAAPGFIMNPYAVDHVLTNIPPTVDAELALHEEGLRWVDVDPFYSYLDPDGGSIVFWRDVGRTAAEIRRFSPRDAERYRKFNDIMTDLWSTIVPYLQGHPRRLRPLALAQMVAAALRKRGNLAIAARYVLGSPGSIIDEWFTSPQLRAALAAFSVATMSSLDEPGSGVVLSMMAVQHRWGVRRPRGGNQRFVEALAAAVRRHGGRVRTNAQVVSIDTNARGVVGVTLSSGEHLPATNVVCTVDPWTMCHGLLPEGSLPDHLEDELRGMSVQRNNISAFKADIAVNRPLRLPRHQRGDVELPGTVMLLAPSIDYVRRSTAAALRGELAAEIPMWLTAPSALDRTLVPMAAQATVCICSSQRYPGGSRTAPVGPRKARSTSRAACRSSMAMRQGPARP